MKKRSKKYTEAMSKVERNKVYTLSLIHILIEQYRNKFMLDWSDDLNTANALSVLYEVLKDDQL